MNRAERRAAGCRSGNHVEKSFGNGELACVACGVILSDPDTRRTTTCLRCKRTVSVNKDGKVHAHGPAGDRCPHVYVR